jgi:nucleotide-binding universal stress UspA family protein
LQYGNGMKTATISKRRRARAGGLRRPRAKGLTIKNILVPIDFSKPSLSAVEFALPLAKRFAADLHLLHVFEPDYPITSMVALPLIVPELELGRRVRRRLKDVGQEFSVELQRGNIHAAKGRPFIEICRSAREHKIDLIVIATRGNTRLKHLVLGSTAERVVRYSHCPVLVLGGPGQKKTTGHDGHAQPELKKILVPVDFSDCSMKGVEYARQLASHFGSRLVLFHSIAIQYWITNDEYTRYDLPLLTQQSDKIAREQMRELVQTLKRDGVEVTGFVAMGHAGQAICTRAELEKVDLIVMSTHGTTGLKHVLLGSTAEYVVRHARGPALVVPTRERPAIPAGSARK